MSRAARVRILGLGIFLLFGCNQPPPIAATADGGAVDAKTVEPASPRAEEVARNYDKLTLVTNEPVAVDPYLATYCVSAATFRKQAQMRSGPHAGTAVRIFMNDRAAAAFRGGAKSYPVGAVIVKEKQQPATVEEKEGNLPGEGSKPDGVGGMIKRAEGYNPDHGDWEYFYFEDPAHVDSGRIPSCVDCHREAAATDFVFGDWAEQP